jgi:hypothetical protein
MRALVLILAGLSLLACGDSSRPSETPTSVATQTVVARDETQLAESMLITLGDFPPGWSKLPGADPVEKVLDRCRDNDQLEQGMTGLARSAAFTLVGTEEIIQTLMIFVDESAATAAMEAVTKSSVWQCVMDRFNDGEGDTTDYRFTKASYAPLSFPQVGDASVAYRLELELEPALTGGGFSLYWDGVYVRKGRAVFALTAGGAFLRGDAPIEPSLLEEIVRKAEARIPAGF